MTLNWESIGLWAGVALPLFDIPLIIRIIKRRSSADISLLWIGGLWASSVLMAPSAFVKKDMVAMGFNAMNVVMLTLVLVVAVKYRKGNHVSR